MNAAGNTPKTANTGNTGSAAADRGRGDAAADNPAVADPLTIEIPGIPIPKARARNMQGRMVTPAKTRAYETRIRAAAQASVMASGPIKAGHAGYRADIDVFLPVPASWSNKKRDMALVGIIRPTARPDKDNFEKSALDALNGIVFHDDSEVVEGETRKFYSEEPRLTIKVRPVLP